MHTLAVAFNFGAKIFRTASSEHASACHGMGYICLQPLPTYLVHQCFKRFLHGPVVLNLGVLLVSTYVVCERLSVMHEPAGVVEILVQILQNTPILKYSFRILPPPENENCQRSWHFDFSVSEYPLPPRKLKFWQILAL